jgi:ABC-type multidrug transport system fused ATPase/permease subunit
MQDAAGAQGVIELFRSLGASLLAVLRAEAEALGEDFKRSGRQLGMAVALFAGAAGLVFWMLGVVVLTIIAVLALWLPIWAAALLVAVLFALLAGLLVMLAVRQLKQLENPVDNIRRRLADHLDWWQYKLLASEPPGAGAGAGAGSPRITPEDPLEPIEEDDL